MSRKRLDLRKEDEARNVFANAIVCCFVQLSKFINNESGSGIWLRTALSILHLYIRFYKNAIVNAGMYVVSKSAIHNTPTKKNAVLNIRSTFTPEIADATNNVVPYGGVTNPIPRFIAIITPK